MCAVWPHVGLLCNIGLLLAGVFFMNFMRVIC